MDGSSCQRAAARRTGAASRPSARTSTRASRGSRPRPARRCARSPRSAAAGASRPAGGVRAEDLVADGIGDEVRQHVARTGRGARRRHRHHGGARREHGEREQQARSAGFRSGQHHDRSCSTAARSPGESRPPFWYHRRDVPLPADARDGAPADRRRSSRYGQRRARRLRHRRDAARSASAPPRPSRPPTSPPAGVRRRRA